MYSHPFLTAFSMKSNGTSLPIKFNFNQRVGCEGMHKKACKTGVQSACVKTFLSWSPQILPTFQGKTIDIPDFATK